MHLDNAGVPGQQQDADRHLALAQLLENPGTVEHRHCEVKHDGIGTMLLDLAQGLLPITGFANELQPLVCTDRPGDVLAHNRVIVCDQNADRCLLHRSFSSAPSLASGSFVLLVPCLGGAGTCAAAQTGQAQGTDTRSKERYSDRLLWFRNAAATGHISYPQLTMPEGVATPWGRSAELRSRRLHGGPFPSKGPAETRRNQRERLHHAVVAAAAERGGLSAVRFKDLIRLAAVSNSAVYQLFGSKQGCILATVDRLYRDGRRQVEDAYGAEADPEAAIAAALSVLVELIVTQPAAARLCVVDVYEAGAEGSHRVDTALRGYERLWRQSTVASTSRAGLPPSLEAAVVGALHMLIHDRLRHGREGELPELIEPLLTWSLAYDAPPEPLLRPAAGPPPPPSSPQSDAPPESLVRGIAAVAAERGAKGITVREVAARARCSLSTLYTHFASKEDALLGCFEEVRARAFAVASTAYEAQMPDWPRAIAAANAAIFAYLASEPDFARVAFAEILAAGPKGLEHRDEAVKGFAGLLSPGFQAVVDLSPVAAEAMAFGVYALARRQIVRFGPKTLPRIGPTATFFDLAPFLGVQPAAAIANERPDAP